MERQYADPTGYGFLRLFCNRPEWYKDMTTLFGLSNGFRMSVHWPTASEDEVLKYWQGLGYYSRAPQSACCR